MFVQSLLDLFSTGCDPHLLLAQHIISRVLTLWGLESGSRQVVQRLSGGG